MDTQENLKLEAEGLAGLVDDLVAAGTPVIAPRVTASAVEYGAVSSFEQVVIDQRPANPIKRMFLPVTEALLGYRRQGADVILDEVPTEFAPRVALAVLPCDAAGLDIVDRVMDWDYHDELWFGRREATTVVALACDKPDESCFCSATGAGPCDPRGADLLLVPLDQGYGIEVLSEKGAALVEAHRERFTALDDEGALAEAKTGLSAAVEGNLAMDPAALRAWLEENFVHDFWSTLALACHGCGVCTMVCPTCHCFDIVDEQEGLGQGTRRRNWDGCQFGLFTLHSAGHNPRPDQNARYRQRIQHKFAIYPARFGELLCTGCGRCVRACPAGIDLVEILERIQGLAGAGEAP